MVVVCGLDLFARSHPGAQLMSMPIAVGLIALVSAAIVFLASFDAGYLPRIPPITPFCLVGARSYGTYLLHVLHIA